MPILSSSQKCRSGVPLGGIGAGKLEILPNGVWNAFTFLNNWGTPLSGNKAYPGVLGFHLGVFARRLTEKKGRAFLLQTVPLPGMRAVREIRYAGNFPEATLEFRHPDLPVEVTLQASGPFVPGDADGSSIPGARFEFIVRNPSGVPTEVSLLFMGRNILGSWCVGRQNRVIDAAEWFHLDFSHRDRAPLDPRGGRLLLSFSKKGWKTSFVECWNTVRENFRYEPETVRLDAWNEFARSGRLPNRRFSEVASSENREWGSAAAATATLAPRASRSWLWTAAWQVPHAFEPARYERFFRSPESAHAALASRHKQTGRAVRTFHGLVRGLPFPEWFNDALINSLYPFVSSTRYLRDGRFAFYEAPEACPLSGTLDVGFYGSIPLALFFPGLSKNLLRQFAAAQRRDGYMPHDLGRDRLDRASDGTTPLAWKDLNPKFVLMVWRDFAWSDDKPFLRELYPSVRRALEWTASADTNGDGLPDHEGADQTFDLWEMKGPQAYTAGLYLAALKAGIRAARLMKDRPLEKTWARRFAEASFSFERRLWTGRFFGPTCSIAQLAGQWYADMTGLGSIADDRKIRLAVETIRVQNARPTRFGWVNSTLAGGRPDTSSNHTKNLFFGMNYAFASLALARGCGLNKVLPPLERLWDNLIRRQGNPWNQPDMLDARSGRFLFGDSYYRNMAIWSIPVGLARRDKKTAHILGRLKRTFGKSA